MALPELPINLPPDTDVQQKTGERQGKDFYQSHRGTKGKRSQDVRPQPYIPEPHGMVNIPNLSEVSDL